MSHAATLSRPQEDDIHILWYVLVIVVTALVLALQTWGLVVLTLVALAMVPVMFVLLIIMSRP
jgi:hypothetical protein